MKIICIGRNYVAHAAELGNEVPTEPVIFMKPASSLVHNNNFVQYPNFTTDLHYECEIVLQICKEGKNIAKENALQYFDKYTLGIDFTARDVQQKLKDKGLPWEKAKAFDQSAVIGYWVNISDEQKQQVHYFSFEQNNKMVQLGDTSLMIFDFATIITEVSKYFTINIGDIIYTGTPAGVGACTKNDKLIGKLNNQVVLNTSIV
jgi:2-keto-4-pentenoate hydratase/2-oxohepta-3-ene-1,7-dioic acid hydratase in catechol pathway